MALTITFDLEDNRASPEQEVRFERMSNLFLDFLGENGITATVFIVGELARTHPSLVERVAREQHEVGLHGLRHVTLAEVGRQRLRGELIDGREMLEELIQAPVRGFRAPIFSLTPGSAWAVEQILEAGFGYSSSVLPAANPLHGWPGSPQQPCRWSNGLLELPCPVAGIGRAQIPFLGGVYLRYLPMPLVRRLVRGLTDREVPWSYVHPYDLDAEEPFFVLPHAGWLTSRLVHLRREATLPRLRAVIAAAGGPGRPLGEIARRLETATLPRIGST